MKPVAKKKKSADGFFSGSMTGFYGFFPPLRVGLHLQFIFKNTDLLKGKIRELLCIESSSKQTKKHCRELKKRLWTESNL